MKPQHELVFGNWWQQGKEPKPLFTRKQMRFLAAVLYSLHQRRLIDVAAIEEIADLFIGVGKHYNAIRFVQWATKGDVSGQASTRSE